MTGGRMMGDGGAGNMVSIGSLGQANALSNMSIGQSGQAIEVAANTIIGGDSACNLNTINVADGSTLSGNAGVGGHVNLNVETGGSATVGDFTDANVNVSGDLTGGNVNNSGLAVGDGTVTVAHVDGQAAVFAVPYTHLLSPDTP